MMERATYHNCTGPRNDPSNPVCVPVDAVRVPERRLVEHLLVVCRTELVFGRLVGHGLEGSELLQSPR